MLESPKDHFNVGSSVSLRCRAANVKDKDIVEPLLEQAPRLFKRFGKSVSNVIADKLYYSTEVFAAVREAKG